MIALLSDIHANYIALEAVLQMVDELGITEIYCLGDTVGYFSQVNEVCDELRRRNAKPVMGNHDWYMAADSFCPRSQSVNDCLVYQRKVISEENLRWIQAFPIYRQVGELSIVHGGWTDPIDEYLHEPTKEYFDKIGGKYFASGHTHVPKLLDFGDKKYCNPGSVGQPRDGDNRAAFATWDGKEFELHRVAYDFKAVGPLMEAAGFSGYYYGSLAIGAKNLGWHDGQEHEYTPQ